MKTATLNNDIQTTPPWVFPARYARKGDRVLIRLALNLPDDSKIKWWIEPVNKKALWEVDSHGYGVGAYEEDITL